MCGGADTGRLDLRALFLDLNDLLREEVGVLARDRSGLQRNERRAHEQDQTELA